MITTIKSSSPLVSCLCISHKRPNFLKVAINCFIDQDYQNKELVVVHNSRDFQTIEVLQHFENANIRPVALSTNGYQISIGELRNLAVEAAQGIYLCTWDDDDWHSPARIKNQIAAIHESKKRASILTNVLMFDKNADAAYFSHHRMWEFSVMFEKQVLEEFGISYQHINRSEDYYFVNDLIRENLLFPLLDPTLYIYHATGENTCDYGHFQYLYARSEKLLPYQTMVTRKAICGELAPTEAYRKMQTANFLQNLRYVPVSDLRL